MTNDTSTKPGWRHQSHGTVGSTGLVALADATVRAFELQGVPLPAGNRISRARDVIEQSHDGRLQIAKDDPETNARVARAIRDIVECHLIARTLPGDRDPVLNGKLKVMLTGSEKSHKPRDNQFELLVGAMFGMTGIRAWLAEPDLRFALQGEEWGVAAKRVRSGGQLGPRTTRARQQLEEQELRGFIAVNVDAFVGEVPPRGAPAEVGEKFNVGVKRLKHLLPDLATQTSLLGVMAIGATVGWEFFDDGRKPKVTNAVFFQGRSFVKDADDVAVADEVFNALEQGFERRMTEIQGEIQRAIGGVAQPTRDPESK